MSLTELQIAAHLQNPPALASFELVFRASSDWQS